MNVLLLFRNGKNKERPEEYRLSLFLHNTLITNALSAILLFVDR